MPTRHPSIQTSSDHAAIKSIASMGVLLLPEIRKIHALLYEVQQLWFIGDR